MLEDIGINQDFGKGGVAPLLIAVVVNGGKDFPHLFLCKKACRRQQLPGQRRAMMGVAGGVTAAVGVQVVHQAGYGGELGILPALHGRYGAGLRYAIIDGYRPQAVLPLALRKRSLGQ